MGRALSAPARRLLLLLGRFGYLLPCQAAALDGHTGRMQRYAAAELARRGWLGAWRLSRAGGAAAVLALTPAGLRALRALPGAPPRPRGVRPARLDALLAAADLALALAPEGAWRTWAEWCPRGTAWPRPAPAGVLVPARGPAVPVWIALHPREGVADLRRALEEAARLPGLGRGRICARPGLCPRLAGLDAEVVPWEPPHLRGGEPFLPGWQGEAGAGGPGPLGQAILSFLDRFGAATAGQVASACGCRRQTACGALHRLRRLGLAAAAPAGARGVAWLATAAGLAASGSGRRPASPAFHLAHTLALVDLARALEAETGGRWEAEREIAAETRGRFADDPVAPPDGRLTLPCGRRVLVQLQRSRGDVEAQLRAAWRQRRLGLGDEVWFFCYPGLAAAYRRALQEAERAFVSVRDYEPRHDRPPGRGRRAGSPRGRRKASQAAARARP